MKVCIITTRWLKHFGVIRLKSFLILLKKDIWNIPSWYLEHFVALAAYRAGIFTIDKTICRILDLHFNA